MVHIVEHWDSLPDLPLPPPANQSYMVACDGTVRQQFSLVPSSNHTFFIKSHEGLCLDAGSCNRTTGCYPLKFVHCSLSKPSLHFHRSDTFPSALVTHEGTCSAGGCGSLCSSRLGTVGNAPCFDCPSSFDGRSV